MVVAMIADLNAIRPGVTLTDPIGRHIEVRDVFVPKNQRAKSEHLPAAFRQLGRKIIVFQSGSVGHLSDIARRYSLPG